MLDWVEQDRIEHDRPDGSDRAQADRERAEALAEVERALAGDPSLRRELEALRADRSLLRAMSSTTGAESIEPPPDLLERVELALERDLLLNDADASGPRGAGFGSEAGSIAEVRTFPLGGRARPRRPFSRWAAPAIAALVVLSGAAILIWQPISAPNARPGAAPPDAPTPLALAPTPTPGRESDLAPGAARRQLPLDPRHDPSTEPPAFAIAEDGEASAGGPPIRDGFAEADALRADLERLLQGSALAGRTAPTPPNVPPAPHTPDRAAALSKNGGENGNAQILDAQRAAQLAREGRLGIAVRGEHPHRIRQAISAAQTDGLPGAATLRPSLPAEAIAQLPPALAAPPSELFDLTHPMIARQRSAPARPPELEPDAHAESRPSPSPEPSHGVGLPPRPRTPVGLGYYRLEFHPSGEALDELRNALLARLPEGSRVEFVELPDPIQLPPEADTWSVLWWTQPPDTWRPRVSAPLVITDDARP